MTGEYTNVRVYDYVSLFLWPPQAVANELSLHPRILSNAFFSLWVKDTSVCFYHDGETHSLTRLV